MTLLERIARVNKILATPAWHGTPPLPDNAAEWNVVNWEKALGIYQMPVVEYFIPTYRRASGSDGMLSWPLQEYYFATADTATEIAKRYGDVPEYHEIPFTGTGGLFNANAAEYCILVKGEVKNAGLIANYYSRHPEESEPGIADKQIRQVLGLPAAA